MTAVRRVMAVVGAAALAVAVLAGCGAATDTTVSGKVVEKHIEHDAAELEYELVVETTAGERHIFGVDPADWRRYQVGQQLNSGDLKPVQ